MFDSYTNTWICSRLRFHGFLCFLEIPVIIFLWDWPLLNRFWISKGQWNHILLVSWGMHSTKTCIIHFFKHFIVTTYELLENQFIGYELQEALWTSISYHIFCGNVLMSADEAINEKQNVMHNYITYMYYISYNTILTIEEYWPESEVNEDTPYHSITGKQWVFHSEHFLENWPCYNYNPLFVVVIRFYFPSNNRGHFHCNDTVWQYRNSRVSHDKESYNGKTYIVV